MKKSFIAFFEVVFFSCIALPLTAEQTIVIRLVRDPTPFVKTDMTLNEFTTLVDQKKGSEILQQNPDLAPTSAMAEDAFVIRTFNEQGKSINLQEANLHKIVFSEYINSSYLHVNTIDLDEQNSIYKNQNHITIAVKDPRMSTFTNARHKTLLLIDCKDAGDNTITRVYCRRFDTFEQYGWDPFSTRTVGIWAPYGLLGTNFEKTDAGIGFTAAPIGAALGTKYYCTEDFFIGLSLLATWSITEKTDSSNTVENDAIFAKSIGTGLLFDVGSVIYLGFVYNWDLTLKNNNPGWYGLIGFGSGLLTRLSTGKK